ncbi:unnamed protein product [Medioppia subpectinata]|uniref:TIL domain-containing protein n=1 Tax=Medioppia subpectinata TaxID=1979941 RepID=A0A7R9PWX1_9ACAR|nr:unnamed protein product [Medioppia subpectinata]CAG2104213.1 unnamed protein product [Medioppia subpectinata]
MPKSQSTNEPVCDSNGFYTKCDTACPITCQNYDNPPKFCTFNCVKRCACNQGYIKESIGSIRCVLPENCPGTIKV